MISEGQCDTKDWSNDPENSALPYFSIHSQNIAVVTVFLFTTSERLLSKRFV